MPNWVYNKITLKGPESVLKNIFMTNFDFQKLHPCPMRETTPAKEGWYEWCVAHWGTKWGADDIHWRSVKEDELVASMYTAWDPPSQLLAYLTTKNPGLTIECNYIDEGWGFVGTLTCVEGRIERKQVEPHNYKPSVVATFADGVSWFDFEGFIGELQEYGVKLDEVEKDPAYKDGPVTLYELSTTYEESRTRLLSQMKRLNEEKKEEAVETSAVQDEQCISKPDNNESGL